MRGDFDGLLDSLADRIAAKVGERIGAAAGVSKSRLLTIKGAAEYLGRTKEAVQQIIASGKIPTVRTDRRVFLDVKDLDIWIERSKLQP